MDELTTIFERVVLNTMQRSIYILGLLFILGSCASEESSSDSSEAKETVETEPTINEKNLDQPIPPETPVDDVIHNNLQDFFSPEMCAKIRAVNGRFRSYNTNQEFDAILTDANDLLMELDGDIYSYPTKFKNEMPQEYGYPETSQLIQEVHEYADSLLPIVIECGGECAQVAFFLDFESIKKPCRLTPSEADDELVEIMRRVYGVYGNLGWLNDMGWREWWGMEDCWYTFGNHYMYQTFIMIQQFEARFPDQFVERIAHIKQSLVDQLKLEEGDKTQNNRVTILNEFEIIMDLGVLTPAQEKQLTESMEFIETSDKILFETEPY